MNRSTRQICCLFSLTCLTLLALPIVARGDGAVAFLNTPRTLIAGEPFSWMEPGGGDWNGTSFQPTGTMDHAEPSSTLPRGISVVTSNTGTNLIMVFTIEDGTRTQPGGLRLRIGDKVIIQIDPNNSGHLTGSTTLSVGDPAITNDINRDYRFEIVINSGALQATATGFTVPRSSTNPMTPFVWRTAITQLSFATVTPLPDMGAMDPADRSGPTRYRVTATIPLNMIGNPTTDIGIAFGVINDLGYINRDGTDDVTGSEFPLSMGLDGFNSDLGLVDPEQASGSWLNPARWGVGYFSTTTQDVNFTRSPSFYWSDSIKISKCNENDWGPIPNSGAGTDQTTLNQRWYRYNPNVPCKMRIWFNTFKGSPGATTRRFVIFWGRPGISPRNWIFVGLTGPVVLTSTETRSFFTWNNVPAVTFMGGHPCLRIYILPETLLAPFDTETSFRNITLEADLTAMETRYGFQPDVDSHSAQMNFTATEPGTSCPTGSPCACLTQPNDRDTFAQVESVQFLPASYNMLPDGAPLTTDSLPEPQTRRRDDGRIRVTAEGYGVQKKGSSNKPYVYLERLGGIAWSINENDLRQQPMQLEFDISNPSLFSRDFTGPHPAEIRSPTRDVFVVIDVKASPGTTPPVIVSRPPAVTLNAGETTKGAIVIARGGPAPPPPPDFKHWGLSFHGGISFPHGDFNTLFNPGPNLAVDLEYRFNQLFSVEGIYGFHHFTGDAIGFFRTSSLNVHHISVNGKVYGNTSPVRPFFNFGGGVYNFGSGPSVHGGLNFGGGVQFDVSPRVAVEGVYNFHHVFTSGSNTQFSALQGGVRFRF